MEYFAIKIRGCKCSGFKKDVLNLLKQNNFTIDNEVENFLLIFVKEKKAYGVSNVDDRYTIYDSETLWTKITDNIKDMAKEEITINDCLQMVENFRKENKTLADIISEKDDEIEQLKAAIIGLVKKFNI